MSANTAPALKLCSLRRLVGLFLFAFIQLHLGVKVKFCNQLLTTYLTSQRSEILYISSFPVTTQYSIIKSDNLVCIVLKYN